MPMIMGFSERTHPSSPQSIRNNAKHKPSCRRPHRPCPINSYVMDTQDAFERYSSNLPSLFAAHLSQGLSLSVWRTPPPKNSSKPISNEHSKSLNLNLNLYLPRYTVHPHQRQQMPPLDRTHSYPNVPSSKESGWRVRSVFEEIPTTVIHLEGRLRPHPPPTPKIMGLMTVTLGDPQPRDSIWPHRDRAGPFNSPNPSSQPMLFVDPPKLVLARIPGRTNRRCSGEGR